MRKKRILILITCVALLMSAMSEAVATATAPPSQASDVTFNTPEEAITYFFEGVAKGDFSKILQACAINEISENFKFDLYIARMRAFVLSQDYAPANYPLYVDLNNAEMTSRIASQVKLFAYSLLSSEKLVFYGTNIIDVNTAQNFMNDVDPSRLAQLEVNEIGLPDKARMNESLYLENAIKNAHIYGADDSTERVALFSFEQNYYVLGFTLLRYGENWNISSASSGMANMAGGIPAPITLEQFESMTK